jgi:predicted amidohydrolase YtcJ
MARRLLTSATVRTVDATDSVQEAMVYDETDGVIVAIGVDSELRERFPDAIVTELAGRCVVPGFVDCHHHLLITALYAETIDCRPEATPSAAALCHRLRERAASMPAGSWIVGTQLDPARMAGRAGPSRHDLDRACPEHPVLLIHFTFHQGIASSRALERAGIGRTTGEPKADGAPVHAEEAIPAHLWLRMATYGAAVASGHDRITGSLEPGKRADLAVLSADPCRTREEDLSKLRVTATVLGGHLVHGELE